MQVLVTQRGHSAAVTHVSFSPTGELIASCSRDRKVIVTNVATGQQLHCFSHDEEPKCSVFSPAAADGDVVLATASADGTLSLYDVGSGEVLESSQVHTEAIHRATFSPDGSKIATASADKTAKILRTQSLQCELTISGHKGQVLCADFSPDGRQLATASRELTCRVFEIATGAQAVAITQRSRVLSCSFAPSGATLATCAMDGVRLFDACSGEKILEIPSDASSVSRPVSTFAFSPYGDKLATGGDNGICIFDFKLQRQVAHSKRHREAVSCVAFSPDGNMVATASADRTVLIQSVDGGPDEGRTPCLQGLHCVLNLPSSSPDLESHPALSTTSDVYEQLRSFSHERSALGRHSCRLPFGDDEVKDVAAGPRHIAILLNDGRVCRMEFGLNQGAVQDQVERAEARATLASGRRGRLGSAARSRAAHGVYARRARHVPHAERSVQPRRADGSSREPRTEAQRQINAEVWDQQQQRDRERLGLSGRASARTATAGSRSVSAQSSLGRAQQSSFAYHPALGLEAAAASLEMRASAGLGIPRRALPASPPEAMIQVVQDMFGSVPRDVIIRDLRATGSIEATIDHLLSRNSGGSDSESNASSPSPNFDGGTLGGLSRPSAARSNATAPTRSSSSRATASAVPGSAESLYSSLLSAAGSGGTSVRETHEADCPSSFHLAEIEWWDVTERFTSISAMLSDLVAVSKEGKLCCWPWEQSTTSVATTAEHPRMAELKLTGESIKILSTCDTHGVVITSAGLVATWVDRCFRCSPVTETSQTIASVLEQPATTLAAFESDPVTLLDTSNFLVTAVTTSGKVYWWGLKPYPQRQQLSADQLKRPAPAGPVVVGCKVTLKNAARYKTGALACSTAGVPCLLELARNILTGSDVTEYDFKVLPWGTQRDDDIRGASRRCKLSDVLFLAGSETEEAGEVLKVDGSVAAVLFPANGDKDFAPTSMADALQRCKLVHTSELRRVDTGTSYAEAASSEKQLFESVPQRVQIAGVGPCLPFSCGITDHKVSLLLKRASDGKTFSYEADLANQRYSARHMPIAAQTMWSSRATAVQQVVAGNAHDCMLIRDINGAAFPSRGLPVIAAASISQRMLPCFGGRAHPHHCNVVTVVFRHAELYEALVSADLAQVKVLVDKGGAEMALFEANQNVLHLCGNMPSATKAVEVVNFLLDCAALKTHLNRLLTAQDAYGRTAFMSSVRADNLGVAEAILCKVDALESPGARRWSRAGDSLHARSILAADITGNTSLHFLCATGSKDDTRVHLRTMCADSGTSSKKLQLTKVLLETTDLGGAQDHSNRTALASLLVSRVNPPVDVAVALASDWDVARHTVEGSEQTNVSAAQLDEMMFRVLSAHGGEAERIMVTLTDTVYTKAPSLAGSLPIKPSVAQRLVESVVRVFSAVCATGKVRSVDSASTCAQVKVSCRRVFCMMPVLATEALVRSADAVITPVRLGMVAPVSGVEVEQNTRQRRHEISRDVFEHTASSTVDDLTGDLDHLTSQANDAQTDGEDPEPADLDGEVDELSMMEFAEDEEGDDAARPMHDEDDEDDEDDDEDEHDHDERDDDEIEASESRQSAMEEDFIIDDAQHPEAVDLSADEDEALGGAGLNSGLREREKAAALGQQTAAAMYACAFGRLVRELVELHQELRKEDESARDDNDQELQKAMGVACSRLERTWEWLFVVMDCTESQLRANSGAPQPKTTTPIGSRRNAAGFQNALLGVLRAQSADTASASFSSIDICQYRAIAYVTDAFVYFVSHPTVSVATRPTVDSMISEDSQLESFFVRTPSTTPHGAASPVTFGASIRRGLPLAERPHLLTPRATKRAMFGDLDTAEGSSEAGGDDRRPHKKQKRAPAGHVSFSAFLDASSQPSGQVGPATGKAKGNGRATAPVSEEAIVERYTPSDILERWEATFRRLADAFLEDVGEETHSCLSHMAGFPIKQKIFRKKAGAVCAGASNTIKVEVSRSSLLGDLFASLDRECSRRRRQAIPLVCRNLQAEFRGEQGEGDGVTRGLLAAASSKLASCEKGIVPPQSGSDVAGDDAPLFHAPGKEGFFAPLPLEEFSDGRIRCFTNVGRIVGLSLLHNLPISLAFTRPTIKFLLGRSVSWTDLAFHSPDLYENFRKLVVASASSGPDFAEASGGDLTFEVTESRAGGCAVTELRPGGAQEAVTAANVKSYVMLYAAHRMVGSIQPALEAMRRGILQVMPESLLASLTAEDFVLLLNGCGPRVDVRWLKGITAFKDSRAEQSRLSSGQPLVLFEKLYWAAVSSMTDAERRELLYFATGSPVHPHDFSGRRLTVHVKSDTNDLPSAQVCTLEMNVPFYSDQAELKRKLLTSFKCETYDFH